VLQQTSTTQLFRFQAPSRPAQAVEDTPSALILRGRQAVLEAQPLLAKLAEFTAQTGEADAVEHFLSTPDAIKKVPHLLLIGDPARAAAGLTGAVLMFEYRTPLAGTRVFATADGAGRRGVLAPPGQRAHTAALAANIFLELGAHIVHLAFCEGHSSFESLPDPENGVSAHDIASELEARGPHQPDARWSFREIEIPSYLPLLPTFDATLARIGQRTRSNLRYYRRRAEHDLGSIFVPIATPTLEEFLAFNLECTFAVPEQLATFRYRTYNAQPNHCIRGVRDRSGRWLSLVGTRRHSGFVEIDWQMNRDGLPAASLATVMRSYLIAHEISLGSTRLYIEGGTPQPIGYSFHRQRVGELTVTRNSRYVQLLKRFAPHLFPPKNYIRQILLNPELQWKPC